jgi:hypothetical protein
LFGKTLIYVSHYFAETPNIDTFLEAWGIEIERAFVRQSDPRSDMNFQRFTPTKYNEGLNPEFDILSRYMRHVVQTFEGNAHRNMETFPILSAGNSALYPFSEIEGSADAGTADDSKPEFNFDAQPRGEFDVGVVSIKTRFEGVDEFTSNVVAFGGEEIFIGQLFAMQNANNAEFFVNMMNDISGKDGFVPNLIPKSFSVPTFQIPEGHSGAIATVFILVLPLVIIVAGVVVWVRRIRR